jgi:hypothetical protein
VSHKCIEELCASIAVYGSNLGASDPIIPMTTSKARKERQEFEEHKI